jgi:DNA-binding XRE family transcriptional regulator
MTAKIFIDKNLVCPYTLDMDKMIASKSIGGKIALARRRRGLTQTELAQLAGCSRQTVNEVEHDHHEPTMKILRRLARVLKCSVVSLWPEEK